MTGVATLGRMRTVAAAALVLVLGSCTSHAPNASLHSSAPPAPSGGSTTPASVTPSASGTKTSHAFSGTGHVFTAGSAHLKITGGFSATRDLPFDQSNSMYSAPPSPSGMEWRNPRNDDQTSFFGSASTTKTDKNFSYTIALTSIGFYARSDKGECTLTFTQSSSAGVTGSVSCPSWKLPDGRTITVTGSFTARP